MLVCHLNFQRVDDALFRNFEELAFLYLLLEEDLFRVLDRNFSVLYIIVFPEIANEFEMVLYMTVFVIGELLYFFSRSSSCLQWSSSRISKSKWPLS